MNRDVVESYLHERGIKRRYKGFKYLVDAVAIVCDEGMACKMMPIYAKVARRHGDTPERVERAMRYAVHKAEYEDTVQEFLVEAATQLNKSFSRTEMVSRKEMWRMIKDQVSRPLVNNYDVETVTSKVCNIALKSSLDYELAMNGAAAHKERVVVHIYISDFKELLEAIKNGGDEHGNTSEDV